MSNNGAREIFLSAIRGEQTHRPAVGSVNQTATYEQMDSLGVKWPDANMDSQLMATLAEGAHRLIGFDAIKVPFCQTIEQEALGCTVYPGDDKNLPSIKEHAYEPLGTSLEMKEIVYPDDFLTRGRVPVLIEAVKLLKSQVGHKVAVVGGVIGPFSITSELLEISKCMKVLLKKPAALDPFLEVATKCGIELAAALVKAGADVICVEDMMASVSMISPRHYKNIVLPWQTKLMTNISVLSVLHICGKIDSIVQDMISTGTSALSFEPKVDIEKVHQAVKEAGVKMGLIGGIDTIDHLFYGDADSVYQAALRAKQNAYTVIAPSCSIPPATPTENLKAMVRAVHPQRE